MRAFLSIIPALLLTAPVSADRSPCAGEETTSIKSLSEHEVRALRSGEGMGFAKLAELNRYPGPRHVLELADELGLTQSQLAETEALFAEMRTRAITLGEELVEAESALDRQFAAGAIDAGSLEATLLEIGEIRARLRYVHLEAHLRQKQLLSARQVAEYDNMRGYRPDNDRHAGNPSHHE